jgi:hypothetical protein
MSMPNTTDEPLNGLSLNAERKLSDGGLRPLADLIDLLGIGCRVAGDAVLRGADPIIRFSPPKLVPSLNWEMRK